MDETIKKLTEAKSELDEYLQYADTSEYRKLSRLIKGLEAHIKDLYRIKRRLESTKKKKERL